MNLIIDVGNSFIKLAIFRKEELLVKQTVDHNYLLETIIKLEEKYLEIENVIISSVGNLKISDLKILKEQYNVSLLTSYSKLPFKNLYTTPSTLGVDRIALVCAAVHKLPHKNVLIIDAGTCITYDFIDDINTYHGGAISPGINLRYQSLNNHTVNLPLLKAIVPKALVGNSTKNSIHSGVINGVVNEIEGVINLYKLKYRDLTVILTGGDTNFLSKQLKSSIFANSNFLLEGLNYMLHYNLNE